MTMPTRLLSLLFPAICLFFIPPASHAAPDSKPNILILYADDLGYGDLKSFSKDSKIPTPHLDRLADQGMRFTDAHSSSGICTPSRYALLTGRYHWRKFHGIVGAFGGSAFDAAELTMAEMLQQQGYITAAIGKWHLGWDWLSIKKPGAERYEHRKNRFTFRPEALDWSQPIADGPLAHGFDYYFGDTVINFPPYAWIENDRVVGEPTVMMDPELWPTIKEGNWECRQGPMIEGWNPYENIPTTTAKAVAKIREYAGQEQPFFLYFAFPSPHAPIIPNDEFDGTSQAGPYGDFIVETDAACGTILEALDQTGQSNNTIVIFSADNGAEKYALPRLATYGHWSSGPLRGLKQDIYEGGHRVPTIIKWPGQTTPGSVYHGLTSQIDIMATLTAALGVTLPDDQAVDSLSFFASLSDPGRHHRDSLVHNTSKRNGYAIREGNWVLIDAKTGYNRKIYEEWDQQHGYTDDELPVELYNLADDLAQKNNLAADHPEKVAKLQALLKEIQSQGSAPPQEK